jgi:vacuolar-type H+-ATPase subunit I/STV1
MVMIALAIIGSLIVIAGLIKLSSDNVTQVEHKMAKDDFYRTERLETFLQQRGEQRRIRYNATQQMPNEPFQMTYERASDEGNISISVPSTDLDAAGNLIGELNTIEASHRNELDRMKDEAAEQTRSMIIEERSTVSKQFHERAQARKEHNHVEVLANTEAEKKKKLMSDKLKVDIAELEAEKQKARYKSQHEAESKKDAPKIKKPKKGVRMINVQRKYSLLDPSTWFYAPSYWKKVEDVEDKEN